MSMLRIRLFVVVVSVALLSGCASIIMTEQQILSETSAVLGVSSNELIILQKHPSISRLIYTAKVKSGQEYICQINASDVRADKNVNPPTCVKTDGQLALQTGYISPTKQRSNPFPMSGQQIDSLIKKTKEKNLSKQIEGATPFLLDFLPRVACLTGTYLNYHTLLPRYTTSDSNNQNFIAPEFGMKFHDHRNCLTIERISDWKSLAKNAISLSILYVADDSGESRLQFLQLVEQSDGSWLARF